jgi:hypothetical protein
VDAPIGSCLQIYCSVDVYSLFSVKKGWNGRRPYDPTPESNRWSTNRFPPDLWEADAHHAPLGLISSIPQLGLVAAIFSWAKKEKKKSLPSLQPNPESNGGFPDFKFSLRGVDVHHGPLGLIPIHSSTWLISYNYLFPFNKNETDDEYNPTPNRTGDPQTDF